MTISYFFDNINHMKYIDTVQKVLNYIENNIRDNFTLEELSERFSFSMFHFNRIFKATSGEPVMEYVKLRKLESAAQALISGGRIVEVALDHGFGSQEAFTRSFKKTYGMSPGRFVRERPRYIRHERIDLVGLKKMTPPGAMVSGPEVIEIGTIYAAGLSKLTPVRDGFRNDFMHKLWGRLFDKKFLPAGTVEGGRYCGICSCKGGNKFSYLAGVVIGEKDLPKMKRPLELFSAAPSKYLRIKFKGGFDELAAVHKYVYASWLPDSDFISSACHNIELYPFFPLDENRHAEASSVLIPV